MQNLFNNKNKVQLSTFLQSFTMSEIRRSVTAFLLPQRQANAQLPSEFLYFCKFAFLSPFLPPPRETVTMHCENVCGTGVPHEPHVRQSL